MLPRDPALSTQAMRLFLAVLLPGDALDAVDRVAADLRAVVGDDGVRWVPREQYHFTLKFLGDVPGPVVHRVMDAADAAARLVQPFDVALADVGAFPNDARPGTLWLGASAGVGPMTDLSLRLETELARHRLPRDRRPLKAHLTLARVKGYAGEASAARVLRTLQVGDVAAFRVDRFALMASTLHPTGAEYAVVEEFRLGDE